MTFKLYTDKSSILKKNSRQLQGGNIDVLKDALGYWTRNIEIKSNVITDIKFLITNKYANRPDKVAFFIYGKHDLTWLVLQYNNIIDVTTEFVAGKTIILPSAVRVFTEILTKPIKFQPVK